MKILTTAQLREADQYTIKNEPIASLDLMERASQRFTERILEIFSGNETFWLFCGNGNNGGDGLAIARMLMLHKRNVQVYVPDHGIRFSEDCGVNLNRFKNIGTDQLHFIKKEQDIPEIPGHVIIIDALFGSGLNRPAEGLYKAIIHHINASVAYTVSIDMPSGLMGEDNSGNHPDGIVKADLTLTVEVPKLSFLFPENLVYTGNYEVVNIDLHPEYLMTADTPYELVGEELMRGWIQQRPVNGHKGTFGHVLLLAGSYGKMGAAVLSARAVLAAGAGLITTYIPRCGYTVMQSAFPEAMVMTGEEEHYLSGLPAAVAAYDAIGVGPGAGTHDDTRRMLKLLIQEAGKPLVIDADAINILAEEKTWLSFLPEGSVLTPHPGEFDRLTEKHPNGYQRIQAQLDLSARYGIYIVLKGRFTSISTPDGKEYFNSTGNSGMATAGSGDVLTGIITGLMAQGYSPLKAALTGVYLHGLAGDYAAFDKGEHSLIASDLVQYLSKAFLSF